MERRRDAEHIGGGTSLVFSLNLHLLFPTVESKKPFLSAWPSPIVHVGEHVVLHCQSELRFEMFSLFKEHRGHILQMQNLKSQQSFLIGPVTIEHSGIYRCQGFYSKSPYGSSALSDNLLIVVTGKRAPSAEEWFLIQYFQSKYFYRNCQWEFHQKSEDTSKSFGLWIFKYRRLSTEG